MHLENHTGKHPTSIWGWIKQILEKEGIQGFYNGISVKLTQSVLTAAFLFFFKEEFTTISIQLLRILRNRKANAVISRK
jgi:adenine nucleotide transporter 17